MALDYDTLPIPLAQGVDEKTDDKQLAIGKLVSLQNAVFKSPKQIKKRDGYLAETKNIVGGGTITKGLGVQGYLGELVEMDGTNLYSYSPSQVGWINKGTLPLTSFTTYEVVRNNYSQSCQDGAYDPVTNLSCFIWNDASVGVGYTIIDNATGLSLVADKSVDILGTNCKVLLFQSRFVVIYYDATNHTLRYKTILTSTPTTLSTATTIASDIWTTQPIFDAEMIGTQIVIAYTRSTSIAMYTVSSSFVLSSQYVQTSSSAANYAISVIGDASNNAWVTYAHLNTTTRYITFVVSSALAQVLAPTQIDTSGQFIVAITGIVSGTTATIYYDATPGGWSGIASNTITITGTVGTSALYILNIGLASKAFVFGSSTYMLVGYPGPVSGVATLPASIEQSYFVLNTSAQVVAKIAPGNSGTVPLNGILPEVPIFAAGQYLFTYLYKDDLSANGGKIFYNVGVQAATVNLAPIASPSKLICANTLHVAGGQLQMYDGANVVEHGFHIYPENLFLSSNATSGGGIGIGTSTAAINQVQYVAVYEWQDNLGQIHRSAPSPPLTIKLPTITAAQLFTGNVTTNSSFITSVSSLTNVFIGQTLLGTSAGIGTTIIAIDAVNMIVRMSNLSTTTASADSITSVDLGQIQIEVNGISVTQKNNISIVLYRTINNGTIFYRTSSLTALTYNSKSVGTVTFTDNTPDAALVGNEELYTNGGVVDNIGAPACSVVFKFKNRPCLIPSETETEFWYGQEIVPGSPAEFSDEFTENVDDHIGQITSSQQMDDKIILFGPSIKYYIVGSGPSPNGSNNDFTDATRIAGVSGCSNQASIVEIPDGLVYQDSEKGIWLLDRSLQEHFIGAEVSNFISSTITSSQLFADENKVVFTLNTGTNLVYDYYVNQWETDVFPNGAIDSTVFENDFIFVQADGTVQSQTPGSFTDNGAVVPIAIKTGWLNFGGVEGFQRVAEIQILGQYKSPHTLTINLYTDFGTTPTTTRTIPVLNPIFPYQFRIRPTVMKCESMQIEIIESQASNLGEGFSLSSLAVKIGIKKGLNRLPAGASY